MTWQAWLFVVMWSVSLTFNVMLLKLVHDWRKMHNELIGHYDSAVKGWKESNGRCRELWALLEQARVQHRGLIEELEISASLLSEAGRKERLQ